MNNQRRKRIAKALAQLEGLPTDEMELIKETLEEVQDEEQEAYDNMPESMQNSDRGEASQEAINQLITAIDALGEIIEKYQELIASLEAAQEAGR